MNGRYVCVVCVLIYRWGMQLCMWGACICRCDVVIHICIYLSIYMHGMFMYVYVCGIYVHIEVVHVCICTWGYALCIYVLTVCIIVRVCICVYVICVCIYVWLCMWCMWRDRHTCLFFLEHLPWYFSHTYSTLSKYKNPSRAVKVKQDRTTSCLWWWRIWTFAGLSPDPPDSSLSSQAPRGHLLTTVRLGSPLTMILFQLTSKTALPRKLSWEVILQPGLLQTLAPLSYCYLWRKHTKCSPGMWTQGCPGQVISTTNDIFKYLKLAQ